MKKMTIIVLLVLLIGAVVGYAIIKSGVPGSEIKLGIRGEVKEIVLGKDGITFLVEGKLENDTSYDKASVTANRDTIVTIDGVKTLVALDFTEIKVGDIVEVDFGDYSVAESYPVQAKAKSVKIMNRNK